MSHIFVWHFFFLCKSGINITKHIDKKDNLCKKEHFNETVLWILNNNIFLNGSGVTDFLTSKV